MTKNGLKIQYRSNAFLHLHWIMGKIPTSTPGLVVKDTYERKWPIDYKSLTLDFVLIKYLSCVMIKVFIINCTSTYYFNSKNFLTYSRTFLVVQPFCDYYAKASVFLPTLSACKFSGGSPSWDGLVNVCCVLGSSEEAWVFANCPVCRVGIAVGEREAHNI